MPLIISHGGAAPLRAVPCPGRYASEFGYLHSRGRSTHLCMSRRQVDVSSSNGPAALASATLAVGLAYGLLGSVLRSRSNRGQPLRAASGSGNRPASGAETDVPVKGQIDDVDKTFDTRPSADVKKIGVLLLNIGTPSTTSVDDVRDYLSRFLVDDRVIDIKPGWLKFIVLQILLGSRPQQSAENYKRIWDPARGSPLRFHSDDLAEGLQKVLGDEYLVRIGFQYSEPFVGAGLQELVEGGATQVVVAPMFPHYASGTTGTCLANVYQKASEMFCVPSISTIGPFYNNRLFLSAQAELIADAVGPGGRNVDHTIFSFHGLPVSQCTSAHSDGSVCGPECASRFTDGNRNCYRAQCHETARLLLRQLDLDPTKCSVAFQSRLTLRGTIEWITPYTDVAFETLAQRGVKRLAIVAPSFTADCIETLEELGISGRKEFKEAGGEELILIPCVNASSTWISGLAQIIQDQVGSSQE